MTLHSPRAVMAGLVPAIHVLTDAGKDVDARDERGHDDPFRLRRTAA
jgi:hypothetical protein